MDDCFEDMDEPMYGFRAKVMLTENSPCELGVTCMGVPEDNTETSIDLAGNYGGPNESESSNYQGNSYLPQSTNYHDDSHIPESSTFSTAGSYKSLADGYNENYIERQTGEDFSSDGPPDCRVIFDPSQCRRI